MVAPSSVVLLVIQGFIEQIRYLDFDLTSLFPGLLSDKSDLYMQTAELELSGSKAKVSKTLKHEAIVASSLIPSCPALCGLLGR